MVGRWAGGGGVGDGGGGWRDGGRLPPGIKYLRCAAVGEPVWPSGKAVVSGRTSVRYRFGSPFSSKRLWFMETVL